MPVFRTSTIYNVIDIDECTTNQTVCKKNEKCVNEPGRYSCECKTGYRRNGRGTCRGISIKNFLIKNHCITQTSMNVKRAMSAVTLVSTLQALISVSVRRDTNWQGMAEHVKVSV